MGGNRRKPKASQKQQRSFITKGEGEGEWSIEFGGAKVNQVFYADAGTVWKRDFGTALVLCDTRPFDVAYQNVISFTFPNGWYLQFKESTRAFWDALRQRFEEGERTRIDGLSADEVRKKIREQESPAWGTVVVCAANVWYFGDLAEIRFWMIRPSAAHNAVHKGHVVTPEEGAFSPWVVYLPTEVLYEVLLEVYQDE